MIYSLNYIITKEKGKNKDGRRKRKKDKKNNKD